MDAVLHTQSKSCGFNMRDIEIFPDGSGGVCNLEVISTPFFGEIRFFFDYPSLPEFIENLNVIEHTLSGEAKLGQLYEEPYVMFRGVGLGHITVSGFLAEHTEHTQKLHFSFTTDQTALGPFINSLREITNA